MYAAGLENRPPMLNKDNYVPWSSRIIRYSKDRPNGKMIVDSIENGPYVRRMIATPVEPNLPVPVPKSFHEQTDEELTENDIKRMDADDQAIQTILLGHPEDVYAVNQQGYNAWQNGGIQVAQNAVQNASVQSGGNQNGLIVVPVIANQNETGNVVAARAEGIQLQAEEFDFMAVADELDEIEEFNANCILMANLQHASTSGTQLDKAPVYDRDGSA
uniref:Uncharacterized protein n=1 Tax=Tanacetum cinerariifolium TaxID=118510 RepID=A0A699KBZ0_TANCI|nr:hypothetical protein [Tanacetum cinerariifolium]